MTSQTANNPLFFPCTWLQCHPIPPNIPKNQKICTHTPPAPHPPGPCEQNLLHKRCGQACRCPEAGSAVLLPLPPGEKSIIAAAAAATFGGQNATHGSASRPACPIPSHPSQQLGTALLGVPITVGEAGLTVHGLKVTAGRATGEGSQCKSPRVGKPPSPAQVCLSTAAVQPGWGTTLLSCCLVAQPCLSALLEALRTVRAQRLPDDIAGLPGLFRLGDPGGPAMSRRKKHQDRPGCEATAGVLPTPSTDA